MHKREEMLHVGRVGFYLLQRSCLPLGLSRRACPITASAPAPSPWLNPWLSSIQPGKRERKKKREERDSPPVALSRVLSFPSGAENQGNHAAPLPWQ